MATEEGATEAALAAPDPETAGVAEEEEEPALKHEEEEEEEGPATTEGAYRFPRNKDDYPTPKIPPPPRPAKPHRIAYQQPRPDSGANTLGGSSSSLVWPNVLQPSILPGFGFTRSSQELVKLQRYFADLPHEFGRDDTSPDDLGLVQDVRTLWQLCAQALKDRQLCLYLHRTGITQAMVEVLKRHTQRTWMRKYDHKFVPYYCTSILGSVIHPKAPETVVERMIDEGVLDVLEPLLRGSVGWLEQRLAVRALHHMTSVSPRAVELILRRGLVGVAAEFALFNWQHVLEHSVAMPSRDLCHYSDLLSRGRKSSAQMRQTYRKTADEIRVSFWGLLNQCATKIPSIHDNQDLPGLLLGDDRVVAFLKMASMHSGRNCRNDADPDDQSTLAIVCPDLSACHPQAGGWMVRQGLHMFIAGLMHGTCHLGTMHQAMVCLATAAQSSEECRAALRREGAGRMLLCMLAASEKPMGGQSRYHVSLLAVALRAVRAVYGLLPMPDGDAVLQDDEAVLLRWEGGEEEERRALQRFYRRRRDWKGAKAGRWKEEVLLARQIKAAANQHFNSGDYRAALCGYEEALDHCLPSHKQTQGDRAVLYSNTAQAHLELREWAAALGAATSALLVDPQHAKSAVRRMRAVAGLGQEAGLPWAGLATEVADFCSRLGEPLGTVSNLEAAARRTRQQFLVDIRTPHQTWDVRNVLMAVVCEDFMWLWQQRKNLLPRTVVPPPTAEEQQARRSRVMELGPLLPVLALKDLSYSETHRALIRHVARRTRRRVDRGCETPDSHHSYLVAYQGQSFQERRQYLNYQLDAMLVGKAGCEWSWGNGGGDYDESDPENCGEEGERELYYEEEDRDTEPWRERFGFQKGARRQDPPRHQRLVYRRAYALCGGAHPRLGQQSPLRAVPQPVLRHILEFFLPF